MNILFCTEKWCDALPECGLTNNFHNLFNSFEQSRPDDTINTIHLDECSKVYGRPIDSVLLSYCTQNKTDVVIFSLLGNSPLNPSIETIRGLKTAGIKTVFMWPDTSDWAIEQFHSLRDIADLSVSWDNPLSSFHDQIRYPDNHRMMWVPQDSSMFSFQYQEMKGIDVTFVGSIYADRALFLGLSTKNITILGGQRGKKLSPYQYANAIRNSRISINFPISPCGSFYQVKGRTYEIFACGTMLLERKNPATSKLFKPGTDYIEFDSVKEMDDAIDHFLNNEYEREKISLSGHIKYINFYSSKIFWDTILNEVYK